MPFTATLNNITQAGGSLDLDVTFADSTSGWSSRQSVNIPNGSTATMSSIEAVVTSVGMPLKQTVVAFQILKANIGAVITI